MTVVIEKQQYLALLLAYILIINSVIRPFLLTRFLKNCTTNFDETLHTL